MAVLEGGLLFRSTFASAGAGGKHRGRQLGGKGGMAVLEGGLLFRSTFALAGAHRWSIPTPGARRSEHQRGVLCRCALSIIRRFLVEDSEQVQRCRTPSPETIDLRFMSAKVKKSPCEHRFARFRMPLAAWLE